MASGNKGVYLIFSLLNHKCYVGSSINIEKRLKTHFNMLKRNKHYNIKLQNYVNKYGIENMSSCILYQNNNITDKELRIIEQRDIENLNCVEHGFNIKRETYNIILDDQAKKSISEKAKIRQSSKEYKEKLSIKYSGSKSIMSKLTTEDIRYIKANAKIVIKRYKNIAELADKFKVDRKTIYRVLHNITYKREW